MKKKINLKDGDLVKIKSLRDLCKAGFYSKHYRYEELIKPPQGCNIIIDVDVLDELPEDRIIRIGKASSMTDCKKYEDFYWEEDPYFRIESWMVEEVIKDKEDEFIFRIITPVDSEDIVGTEEDLENHLKECYGDCLYVKVWKISEERMYEVCRDVKVERIS